MFVPSTCFAKASLIMSRPAACSLRRIRWRGDCKGLQRSFSTLHTSIPSGGEFRVLEHVADNGGGGRFLFELQLVSGRRLRGETVVISHDQQSWQKFPQFPQRGAGFHFLHTGATKADQSEAFNINISSFDNAGICNQENICKWLLNYGWKSIWDEFV